MVNEIVDELNKTLCACFKGIKTFGVTQLLRRDNLTIPAVVNAKGEGTNVTVNDINPAMAYHRQIGIASANSTTVPAYGDSIARIQNVHSMALFVYIDRRKIDLSQDEAYQKIQGAWTGRQIKLPPFDQIQVNLTGAILNDLTVWNAEYTPNTTDRLPPSASLMQINYQIVSIFKKDCFKCKDC